MATDFQISHVAKGISSHELAQLFFEEHLNIDLCARLQLQRHLIALRVEGQRLHREVEIVVNHAIAGWVRKITGDRALAYRETMNFDLSPGGTGSWKIVPIHFAQQVRCAGSLAFYPHPDGATREVRGQVEIKMPAVGSLLERYAVSKIEESFAQAAVLTNTWLQTHRSGRPTPV